MVPESVDELMDAIRAAGFRAEPAAAAPRGPASRMLDVIVDSL